MKNTEIAYTLTRETTRHQTGFFVVKPEDGPDWTSGSRTSRRPSGFPAAGVLWRKKTAPFTRARPPISTRNEPLYRPLWETPVPIPPFRPRVRTM
ncbi:MAG: hypothetical protein SWH68_16235 [Thermodesulfobacteriota bacterium]|nr:hypothetical protein [Thermodesulfobacteriota bacterium]